MVTVNRGCIVYRLDVFTDLVKKFGGLDKIKDKASEHLLYGEKLYLNVILDVANKFKEAGYEISSD